MAYDLIVIGTGPGGYVCAIRAAQLGLKTAVVEKRATFGGTCLNIGCIPSKALLHASELFEEAGHSFGKMGIGVSAPKLDLAAMMAFKDAGVDGNVKGVEFLLKKNKVDTFPAPAALPRRVRSKSRRQRRQDADAGDQIHRHRHRLGRGAAQGHRDRREAHRLVDRRAGARPRCRSICWSSGAGVIGLELGSVWRRLGAEGDRCGISRWRLARHGRRSASAGAAAFRQTRNVVQAVVQGHRGRRLGRAAEGECRAGQRRHCRNHRGRRGARVDRPRALHRRARA